MKNFSQNLLANYKYKGMLPIWWSVSTKKPTANIILLGKRVKYCPLRSGLKQRCLIRSRLFITILKVFDFARVQKKINKDWGGRPGNCHYSRKIWLYIEASKEFISKFLKSIMKNFKIKLNTKINFISP